MKSRMEQNAEWVSKIIKIFEREIRLRYLIGKKNLNQFKIICP